SGLGRVCSLGGLMAGREGRMALWVERWRREESVREAKLLSGPPFVSIVKPADLRDPDDPTEHGGGNRPRVRSILVQRQVRSGAEIVGEVADQDPAHVTLAVDDDMVQTLASY